MTGVCDNAPVVQLLIVFVVCIITRGSRDVSAHLCHLIKKNPYLNLVVCFMSKSLLHLSGCFC